MMYINHNSFNLNDLLVQGSATSTIYSPNQLMQPGGPSPLTTPPATYQQQLHSYSQHQHLQHHNKAASIYTYPQVNPYDPNRTVQSVTAQSTAAGQQQRNGRSTSASSLSSVSSTSSNSSLYSNAPTTDQTQTMLTTPSQQATQTQFNNKLANNSLYNPYNFAYYNPYAAANTQLSQNPSSVLGSATNPSVSISTAANVPVSASLPKMAANLSAKHANRTGDYPALHANTTTNSTKSETNNVLTTVDPNYQLLPAPSKNSSPLTNQLQFNTSQTSLATACTDTSSLLLYNTTKNLQAQTNMYSNTHYKPASSQLTFLPTSADIFSYTSDKNQLHSTLGLQPTFTDLTFSAKPIQIHSFGSKTQFSVGVKRKRRFKKPPELRNVLPKNSLMLLHEYRPNVEYRFVCQSGPIHRPMFTMCVDINEHKFEGTGKTKKDARMQAAEKALEFLIQHPEYIQKAVPADKSMNSVKTGHIAEDKKDLTNEEEEEKGDELAFVLNEEDEEEEDEEEEDGKRLKKSEDSTSDINSNADSSSPVIKEDNLSTRDEMCSIEFVEK